MMPATATDSAVSILGTGAMGAALAGTLVGAGQRVRVWNRTPDRADAVSGTLGFTYDRMPHIGTRDGLHYAMGMNGAGVAMGTYIGHCMACRLLGHRDGDTLFAQGRFPAIPFYTGNPWFVPILGRLANVRHSLESALA